MNRRMFANGLGWFGIALGLVEVTAGRRLARALGIPRQATLVRLFGLREIASGLGILLSERKRSGILSRVAGDVLDVAVLGNALVGPNRHRGSAVAALGSVLGVSALDAWCAKELDGRYALN